jgi:glycerol uptake facilitator-like aquaporin
VSGAHFTPVVTIVPALRQAAAAVPPRVLVPVFVAAQSLGAASGAWLAHALRTWVPACRSSRPC